MTERQAHIHLSMGEGVAVDLSLSALGRSAEIKWGRLAQHRQEMCPTSSTAHEHSPVSVDGDDSYQGSYLHAVIGAREYAFVLATSMSHAASYIVLFERTQAESGRTYGKWEQYRYTMCLTPCSSCDGVRSFDQIQLLTLVSAFNLDHRPTKE